MRPLSHTITAFVLICGLSLSACKPLLPEGDVTQETAIVLPSRTPATTATSLAIEYLPTIEPISTFTPNPSPVEPTSPPISPAISDSIFLVSFDGAGDRSIDDLMSRGLLPHFAALSERGLHADYAASVDPSLTAPASNSIASGSYPARTGVVSNYYHIADDSFYWYRSGFSEAMDQAEPIWVTASRAGLTTATVFFAGGNPDLPNQAADYTVGYGIQDAYSKQERISLYAAKEWQGVPVSYSPLLEGSLTVNLQTSDPDQNKLRIFLLILDTSDDGLVDYDQAILSLSPEVDNASLRLGVGDWGPLMLEPALGAGADFLIQDIQPKSLTLFRSGINHNTAAPIDLLVNVNKAFGFFPPEPDEYALARGWITEEDYLHMLARNTRWMAEVAAWVYTTYRPDVLFTWQGGFDFAGHAFWLQDPRQSGYSAERAEKYAVYYRQAAGYSDEALGILQEAVDLTHTTLLLMSDHGMSAQHTTVYVNSLLERAGLLVLDSNNYVNVERSKAVAFTSGGAANIYINLKGRERKGIVDDSEYAQLQQQIAELYINLLDEHGDAVFQRVLMHDQLDALGLYHPNSGDIFLQANPGFVLDDWRGNSATFAPSDYYGGHGYDCNLDDMHAFFIAAGGKVPDNGEMIPPIKIIDVAPTIAAMLGFEPARWVDGESILPLLGR
jgi:predicted AlkP superfamily phosphohydrolase/phosphomutase